MEEAVEMEVGWKLIKNAFHYLQFVPVWFHDGAVCRPDCTLCPAMHVADGFEMKPTLTSMEIRDGKRSRSHKGKSAL